MTAPGGTFRAAAAAVALAAALLSAGRARGADLPAVDLDATLDPAASRITGHARLRVVNRTLAPLGEIILWLYPNHLATRSKALGDVNYHWLYPGWFSPAAMAVAGARADGAPAALTLEDTAAGARTIARVKLATPLPPGATVTLDVDFDTKLPHRFGGFGCDGLRCRMMGGFYPMPAGQTATGFDLRAAPARAGRTRLAVRVPRPLALVVNGVPVIWPGANVPVTIDDPDLPYATIVTDRVLRPETIIVGDHVVHYLHRDRRPPPSENQPLPYVREDLTALVLDTVRGALRLVDGMICGDACDSSGAPRPSAASDPALTRSITLVEAPLRHQLVQIHGGLILVSDQIFRIFPLERLRKYHQLELARAVMNAVLDARVGAHETPAERDMAAGALAVYATEIYALGQFHKLEYAADLLRPFDFVPAVDQLIYAPLLASSSSYFGDVQDADSVRDDVRLFADPAAPSPRLIYNKLLDLLGGAAFPRLGRKVLVEGRPFRTAAAETFGADLGWFWRQWMGPLPRVNYRLESVRVTPAPDGAGSHVEIDVRRQGAVIREPVEVLVEDRNGAKQTLRWDDATSAHLFTVDLPAGLKSVEIDPRARLVETALGSLRSSDDPRYDDRQPPRWRLLYEGFGALLDISELAANFQAAFLLKPQHDLRHAILLTAFHTETIDIGVGGSYAYNFGAQADKNTLSTTLLSGLDVSRINPNFGLGAGDVGRPGTQVDGHLVLIHDTRDFLYDPWRAVGATLGVGYALTNLDDGERLSQVGVSAEALRLFELAPGHVLGVDGSASATFGDIRLPSQLTGAGGPTALRGYFADELLARANVIGSLQLRDDYISGLDWNILHFTTVRGLAGTLFADAAAITSCDDYRFGADHVYYDVGYSFRVLHDAFGVYQQLLSIDFAVPLNRHGETGTCLGRTLTPVSRPPFVVLVSFVPSF